MKEILKKLSLLCAPSGGEGFVSEVISKMFSEKCNATTVDNLFNISGIKKATNEVKDKKKIMLAAHIDEISVMVTDIDTKGFISFLPVGGIDPRILLAQEVIIHGRTEVFGVIGSKPPHVMSDDEMHQEIKFENLYIDVGMNKEQAAKVIRIGDYITFKPNWTELQNGLVSSKSLDNRAGVAVIYGVLEKLVNKNLNDDIIFTATSQEEVGLRGALVSAFGNQPDFAIVIDGTFGDMPGADKEETFVLGGGPAIGIGPNLHPRLSKEIIDYARKQDIPFQIDVESGNTGTDAWVIQTAREGIPVILISIPLRYMHTTVETVDITDLENAAKLISGFIMHIQGRTGELLCC